MSPPIVQTFFSVDLYGTKSQTVKIVLAIREVRPDVVLGHDPWQPYRLHPDHREAGRLVVDGIVAARDPHFFADQDLAPYRPRRGSDDQ